MRFGERTRPGVAISTFGRRPAAGGATYGTSTATFTTITDPSNSLSYKLATFNATGSFVVTTAGLFDVILVGGGAAANGNDSSAWYGGGGAGGVFRGTVYLDAVKYTVTVAGAGGVGAVRIIWPGNTRSFPSTCAGSP